MSQASPEQTLARFAAELQLGDVPEPVLAFAEALFLDWIGSALAGKGARAVESIARFAAAMGPATGGSEILMNRRRTSPWLAAQVNAAASHVAEQDDVHNGSVFHPAAVVFPAALALAQDRRLPRSEFLSPGAWCPRPMPSGATPSPSC